MEESKAPSQSEEEFEKVFKVEIIASRGKFPGMRGATYNLASRLGAYRLRDGADAVRYGNTEETSDNIYMELYFLYDTHKEMQDFVKGVYKIHRLPDLILKLVPEYKPKIKEVVRICRVLLSEFSLILDNELENISEAGSIDYDQAYQDLGSFTSPPEQLPQRSLKRSKTSSSSITSSRSSGRLNSVFKKSKSFREYQSLEHPDEFKPCIIPYACYLIPQGWRQWANNENNVFAASGKFHQFFDGLSLEPAGIPTLIVEFVRATGEVVEAEDGLRHKVEVRIRFRSVELANEMKEGLFKMKPGSFVEGDTIRSHVHMKDVSQFKFCLDTKKGLTEVLWANLRV
ncbi:unnamed protein product [Ectocarpus sp. 4 AP-2014]